MSCTYAYVRAGVLHVWLHNGTNHSSQLQPVSSSDASNGKDLHTQGLAGERSGGTYMSIYTRYNCAHEVL